MIPARALPQDRGETAIFSGRFRKAGDLRKGAGAPGGCPANIKAVPGPMLSSSEISAAREGTRASGRFSPCVQRAAQGNIRERSLPNPGRSSWKSGQSQVDSHGASSRRRWLPCRLVSRMRFLEGLITTPVSSRGRHGHVSRDQARATRPASTGRRTSGTAGLGNPVPGSGPGLGLRASPPISSDSQMTLRRKRLKYDVIARSGPDFRLTA